eukprot:Pompholyxophrys_punicea_v1_NODE_24_length_5258_cov_21.593175.p4 type:complete len:116 gc:universal NODE_24_length_5258_cov_21.593175:208-555(+)
MECQWKKTDNVRVRKHSSGKWEIILNRYSRPGAVAVSKTKGGFETEQQALANVFSFRLLHEFGKNVSEEMLLSLQSSSSAHGIFAAHALNSPSRKKLKKLKLEGVVGADHNIRHV